MELHTVFLHFVNTAVSAGWVVLGVLVLRLVLMKRQNGHACFCGPLSGRAWFFR